MNRRRAVQRGEGRPALVVYCVCAVYLYCVGALLAWAVLPVVTGLTPVLILSGSMAPAIAAGDVVLVGPAKADAIDRGSVITFNDPAHPGRLLTHRVVGVDADGSYRTRGDANLGRDSAGVRDEDVVGAARVLVPAVGMPLIWIRGHAWVQLALWLLGTGIALGYLRAHDRTPPVPASWSVGLGGAAEPAPVRPPARPRPRHGAADPRRAPRPGWVYAVVLALAVATAVVPRAGSSFAAFTTTTDNIGNAMTAATDFCPPYTLHPTADARVTEGVGTPDGTGQTIGLRNRTPAAKSLLAFAVPTAPGCTLVSATLRLNATDGTNGRTLSAFGLAGPFSETVVWAQVPGVTTDPATTTVSASSGWVSFDVTAHASAIRAGTAYGLLVESEAGGPPNSVQTYRSREAATGKPELVLDFQ